MKRIWSVVVHKGEELPTGKVVDFWVLQPSGDLYLTMEGEK